jgi:hypothetical protein
LEARSALIKGRLKAPETSTRDRHPTATVAPRVFREHAMYSLDPLSKNVPPLSLPCPTCGKDMRLASLTPTIKGVVYGYLCKDDHAFEFTIAD